MSAAMVLRLFLALTVLCTVPVSTLRVVETQPPAGTNVQVQGTGCTTVTCLVEGGRPGWDIGKGHHAFQNGPHQHYSSNDGMLPYDNNFAQITANFSGECAQLYICGIGEENTTVIANKPDRPCSEETTNMTLVAVACFTYHFGDSLSWERVPNQLSQIPITVEIHESKHPRMSPPPVNVTRFVNSTTIHLECKDVDSHCLFLFDGLNAIPLHNNTEKCVNIPFRSDKLRYVYQLDDSGKVGRSLHWNKHVMDGDKLQFYCPGTMTINSTATAMFPAAGPIITALATSLMCWALW